jgi:hypothetical protein
MNNGDTYNEDDFDILEIIDIGFPHQIYWNIKMQSAS